MPDAGTSSSMPDAGVGDDAAPCPVVGEVSGIHLGERPLAHRVQPRHRVRIQDLLEHAEPVPDQLLALGGRGNRHGCERTGTIPRCQRIAQQRRLPAFGFF